MTKDKKNTKEVIKRYRVGYSTKKPDGSGFGKDYTLLTVMKQVKNDKGKEYVEISHRANRDIKAGEWISGFVNEIEEK